MIQKDIVVPGLNAAFGLAHLFKSCSKLSKSVVAKSTMMQDLKHMPHSVKLYNPQFPHF